MKYILFALLTCLTILGQRTPLSVNGVVISNPNLTNTASVTWALTGSDIRGTAGGGDNIWTNDNGTIRGTSTVADGGNALLINSSNTLFTGSLVVARNSGTNAFQVSSEGGIRSGLRAGEFSDFSNQVNPGLHTLAIGEVYGTANANADVTLQAFETIANLTNDVSYATWDILSSINFSSTPVVFMEGYVKDGAGVISDYYLDVRPGSVEQSMTVSGTVRALSHPSIADGSTPYYRDTSVTHTSGNLDEVRNNGTNVAWITFDGVVSAVGGISSTASDAAIPFTPTGITNTFGKLAQALFDGVAMTYIVRNGAGTPIYTNTALIPVGFAVLQANGSISITAGSGVVGTLSPL